MMSLKTCLFPALICFIFTSTLTAQGYKNLTEGQWQQDLDVLLAGLNELHPNPFYRFSEQDFASEAEKVRKEITKLNPHQIVVRLMKLIALLDDGHTVVQPCGPFGFHAWFPLRFHRFPEGIFLSVVDKKHASHAGAEVLRIGDLSAEGAFGGISGLMSADNLQGKASETPLFMSNATALETLGIIKENGDLKIEIKTSEGKTDRLSFKRLYTPFDYDWFWNEFRGPGKNDYVTPFTNFEGELPLHLKHYVHDPRNYWFEHLKDENVVYFQCNAILDDGKETLCEFCERLWVYID
ncbi:MAG: hypothetical protein KJ645_08725, partial [Planctomycetes bacterium]|nr:hypothetical protein [Planctomycetota bacterium]